MKIGGSVVVPGVERGESEAVHSENNQHSTHQSSGGESSSHAQTFAGLHDEYSGLGSGQTSSSSSSNQAAGYGGEGIRQKQKKSDGNTGSQSSGSSKGTKGKEKAGSGDSGKVEFPHAGKHQPPTKDSKGPLKYSGDPSTDAKLVAPHTQGKGKSALYNTPDAKKVLGYEQDARENGLRLYNSNPNAKESEKDVVHLAGHEIGADGGETTRAMRLDGDHGHPIKENDPQLPTSFNSYVKRSVDKAKSDAAAPKKAQAELAKVQAKHQGTDPAKLKPFQKAELTKAQANVENAQTQADHANQWMAGASKYFQAQGEDPKQHGLSPVEDEE
jgi:hypothetical protein